VAACGPSRCCGGGGETASSAAADFVPIVTEAAPSEASTVPVIEVKLAGAVVRVGGGIDGAVLTAVLRAVRASASRP